MFKKYRCSICNKAFKQVEELMQHEQVVHGEKSMYACRACRMTFTNGEELKAHARSYHSYKKK